MGRPCTWLQSSSTAPGLTKSKQTSRHHGCKVKALSGHHSRVRRVVHSVQRALQLSCLLVHVQALKSALLCHNISDATAAVLSVASAVGYSHAVYGMVLPPVTSLCWLVCRVDVYALGCILNECMTRRQPWRGISSHGGFIQVCTSVSPWPLSSLTCA